MKTIEIQKELMMSYTGYVGTYTSEKVKGFMRSHMKNIR